MFESLITELKFKFSRSSGPGGQHVNKVSTQVELYFEIEKSAILSAEQKLIITEKLKSRISNNGILALKCDDTRSQIKNREIVVSRFIELIEEALKPVKQRKPTRRSKASVEKRLKEKKIISDKKKHRKSNED